MLQESMEKMQKDLEQKHYQQSEQMALDHQSEIVPRLTDF